MAGKASGVAHVMGGVMQSCGLNVSGQCQDAQTDGHGQNSRNDGGFGSGLNQCGHVFSPSSPLTRGAIDVRKAGLLARGSLRVPAFPMRMHQWRLVAHALRLQSRGRLMLERPDWVRHYIIPSFTPGALHRFWGTLRVRV